MKNSKPSLSDFWSRFGPALVVFIIASGFTILVLANHQWDPMAFVRMGTRYGQGDPNGTIGYDGQFAYQIALKPLGAAQYLDVPAYRYQRILYPITARLASLAQPWLVPWMLIILNIIALTAGTYIMSQILALKKLSRWYAITVGLFAGQLVSLRLDVNEPFALAFAMAGIYAFEKDRTRWGAIFLALSLFSKETSLAFVGGYLAGFFFEKQWRKLIETGLISLGPFFIWQLVLWYALGAIAIQSGGAGATSFNLIPFGGMLAFGLGNFSTFITVALILGPLILLPCIALTISLIRFFRQRWGTEGGGFLPIAFILILHIIMMATLPFSTYVDLPGLLRLTSGLVISTVAFAAITRSHKMLNYSALWLGSLAFLQFFV